MHPYLPILIYVLLALVVPIVISVIAGLGPKVAEPQKYQAYESGYPTEPLLGRFPVKFYLVAMLFVIFDVEAAAFYPWAVQLRELGAYGLLVMIPFLVVFVIGDLYVWKKGGFDWR